MWLATDNAVQCAGSEYDIAHAIGIVVVVFVVLIPFILTVS